MNVKNYEKPQLKFISLRNEDSVAATCWGYHGTDTKLYYDTDGEGWVSFQIASGSCDLNLTNVTYHKNENDKGTLIFDGDSRYEELERALSDAGGKAGNPYHGMGSTIIPDEPKPSWS